MKAAFRGIKLTLICSIVFFVTFILSLLVLFGGIYWFYDNQIDELAFAPDYVFPHIVAVISLIIGVVQSVFFIKVIFIPLNKLISAVKKITNGDYTVRVSFSGSSPLNQLAENFNKMAEELQNNEMLKSDFINNFSHEFKTPASSITGFAEMLKKDITEEEKQEYIDIIVKESRRLSQLSSDVLELSRLENKKEATERVTFNLSEQLRLVIAMLDSKWAEKNINFNLECEEINFNGNEKLLHHLWVNLIDNAVKFSPDNSTVYISLIEEESRIVATIKDEGCGMDEETRARAFERLYRGQNSKATAGNGIGLTLAKRVCEIHKGNIYIEDTGNNGTTVKVLLNK